MRLALLQLGDIDTMNKSMKKILCTALSAVSVFGCLATATACETARPKVEMEIEFNGETYTLEYELYRKLAPSTVNQFLWLAGNGYYDGLCVHDYNASSYTRLYTGAYTYSAENGLTYKSYYEEIKNFENYGEYPASVWMSDKATPTYTVYGEFSDNNFKVTNGNLKETFGSLTMYYFDKDTTAKVYTPYLKAEKEGEFASRSYKYNSATSMFYITLSEGEVNNTKYCTFATLAEDSVETLKDFKEALDALIDSYEDEDSFVTENEMLVDQDDAFVGGKKTKKTFRTPNTAIVIKKVTVKKY